MSEELNVLTEITSDNEIFNKLVEETTSIMKAEIIQSTLFKGEPKLYKESPKSDLIKNKLEFSKIQSVGDVVANRFLTKPTEVKTSIINDFKNLKTSDLATFKNMELNKFNILDGPKIINQISLEKKYSFLNDIKGFEKLVSLNLNSDGKIVLDTEFQKIASLKLKSEGIAALDKDFKQIEINRLNITNKIDINKNIGNVADIKLQSLNNINMVENKSQTISAMQQSKSVIPTIKVLDKKALNRKVVKEIKNVILKLHSVKCVDETGSSFAENFGNDHINMGGVTIDDKKKESKIAEFTVGKDFSDNVTRTFNPPADIKSFINLDSSYPKIFSAFITIAEKDSGGFSDFISKLYNAIKDELDIIITALGAAIGLAVGGTVGTLAGPIGTIIGLVAGAILGALLGWLVQVFKDDIFRPQMTMLYLRPTYRLSNEPYKPSTVSSLQTLNFRDHDGHYQARLSWTVNC